MIGRKFAKLTVIAEAPAVAENYKNVQTLRSQWLCKCDCGNERVVAGNKLKKVKSCKTCSQKDLTDALKRPRSKRKNGHRLTNTLPGEVGLKKLLGQYKRNAFKRGHPWELSKEDFARITSENCHYCEIEPRQKIIVGKTICSQNTIKSTYTYNGIDRKNNTLGYTIENCVPCCGRCNHMKGKMDKETFLEQMRIIVGRFEE